MSSVSASASASASAAAAAAAAAPSAPQPAVKKLDFGDALWPIAFRCCVNTSKELHVNVSPGETIRQLKERVVEAWEGYSVDTTRLIFANCTLENDKTVYDCNIIDVGYSRVMIDTGVIPSPWAHPDTRKTVWVAFCLKGGPTLRAEAAASAKSSK